MKVCNHTPCDACEAFDSKTFKLLEFPSGEIVKPAKSSNRLIFVLSGSLSVHAEGSDACICSVREVILLKKEKKYQVNALGTVQLLVFDFVLPYQMCDKKKLHDAGEMLAPSEYYFHSLPVVRPMELLLESVLYYLHGNVECIYWQKAKQLEVFVIFWNYYSHKELCQFFYPIVHKEISFQSKVITNADKAKTVGELAELCGYSLTKFNKLFKIHFQHSSPYQWMLQQKIPLIRSRLLDITVPIKSVVVEFGFIDQSHLNRYCKRYLNATARKIRKSNE